MKISCIPLISKLNLHIHTCVFIKRKRNLPVSYEDLTSLIKGFPEEHKKNEKRM